MMFLETVYYENTVRTWLIAFACAAVLFLVLLVLKHFVIRRFKSLAARTPTQIDDLIAEMLGRTKVLFLVFAAIYFGLQFVYLPASVRSLSNDLILIPLLLQAALWGEQLIAFLVSVFSKRKEEGEAPAVSISAFRLLSRLALWTLIVLLALANLGVNITALITGLGIGGIAIALAIQNILGDLFASISIMLDKPFVIGDFIVVDEHLGTVEHIGLKTTRLRSLTGEQLVFSNADLLSSRISNYKRMQERRVEFSLGVVYQTPAKQLERIPALIRQIIEDEESARFDRAHFKGYGPSALIFEFVYFVLTADYNLHMDLRERINMKIFSVFEQEGIEFAYPTQTIRMGDTTPDTA